MNNLKTYRIAWGWMLAMTVSSVATAAPELVADMPSSRLARQEVIAELQATQRTHRWDEPSAQWVSRRPTTPTAAGSTRDQVRAELTAFTSSNRWDESLGGWIPRTAVARETNGLTRAEVAASTLLFLETHHWDESTQLWSEHARIPRTR